MPVYAGFNGKQGRCTRGAKALHPALLISDGALLFFRQSAAFWLTKRCLFPTFPKYIPKGDSQIFSQRFPKHYWRKLGFAGRRGGKPPHPLCTEPNRPVSTLSGSSTQPEDRLGLAGPWGRPGAWSEDLSALWPTSGPPCRPDPARQVGGFESCAQPRVESCAPMGAA